MVEENFFLLSAKSIKINTTKFSSHRPKKRKKEKRKKIQRGGSCFNSLKKVNQK